MNLSHAPVVDGDISPAEMGVYLTFFLDQRQNWGYCPFNKRRDGVLKDRVSRRCFHMTCRHNP